MGLLERADALVSAARVQRWCAAFLAVQVILFVICVLGTHGVFGPLDRPVTTDFASFYAAGTLASGSHPALVYDRLAHYAAEQAVTQPGIQYLYFFYPPVFLLLCSLLARLPYLFAFVLFEALTLTACLLTLRAIIGGPMRSWLLPSLSFAPAIWCVALGQNSFLTAALFGYGTLLLHSRRPVAAGLVLACLCYKPHTGLLVPVALAACGSTRAIVGAAVGVVLLVAASALAFGNASWTGFLHAIVQAQGKFSVGKISLFIDTASIYGAASMLGAGHALSHFIQIMVGALVVACVFQSWRREDRGGARHALLISGTILVMPVALFYDMVLLLVASAWLHRAASTTGIVPGERAGLALVWFAGLFLHPIAGALHLPLACAGAAGIFVLALVRVHRTPISLRFGNYKAARVDLGRSDVLVLP